LDKYFPIQDHILIPWTEERAFFSSFTIEKAMRFEKFRSNQLIASMTGAQSFLPKVAFRFAESALGSSPSIGDRSWVAHKGASGLVAFNRSMLRSSQIRAKRMISCEPASWSSPTAFTLVHHF